MKLLVVVDVQNDFVTGSLANTEAQKIIKPLADYISNAWPKKEPIILTRDTHSEKYLKTAEGKKLPIEHCISGTPGWCVVDEIATATRHIHTHKYVDKNTFGYTKWSVVIDEILKEYDNVAVIDEIIICGLVTDICVISNALILKALYPNTKITVLKDFCAGLTPEKHEAALSVMESCQIEVI